jgi:hypothetical protein
MPGRLHGRGRFCGGKAVHPLIEGGKGWKETASAAETLGQRRIPESVVPLTAALKEPEPRST